MSDELQIIDKVLYGVDHFNKRKKQNKSSDFSIFTIKLWKTKREWTLVFNNFNKSLTTTAQDLLHLLAEFAEYNIVKDEMKLVLTYDELQEINTTLAGNFNSTFIKIYSIL